MMPSFKRVRSALIAGGMASVLLVGGMTEAAWTDTTEVSGTFTARSLSAPTLQSCTARTDLLGPRTAEITYKPQIDGDPIKWVAGSGSGEWTDITTLAQTELTDPVNGYYTARFTFTESLLSQLLGIGIFYIGAQTSIDPWLSSSVYTSVIVVTLLFTGCTINATP